jgi:glycosyltransferase involved in cell wall biosynthesis
MSDDSTRGGCTQHVPSGASRDGPLRVLYFGTYDRAYPRNAQVISALRGVGVEVREQHRPVWERRHNWSVGLRQMLRVAEAERALRHSREVERAADVLVVGYPGHFDLPAAKRVARGRPVVFNPLVSLYDTIVSDRGRFRHGTPKAGVVRLVDRRAFRRADVVVADTEAHAAFFREEFGLPGEGVEVCLVGAEDRLFRPGWQPRDAFRALFVGKLIPLHGLETILAAAALAPEIRFRVIGSGQLETLLADRPASVEWVPWVEYERLPDEFQSAGCALGIFGTSAKAGRVIPNKAYQAIACGTPLVTADTPAARELLTDGRDALLVPPGDPAALAAAVRRLASEPALAEQVGTGGRATYEARASEAVLGERWLALLERAVAGRRAP